MTRFLGALCLASMLLCRSLMAGEAPNLGKLPTWAQAAAREAAGIPPPADAEAWVLLSRQEVTYLGQGSVEIRTLRLVQVIKGKGLEEARCDRFGLREDGARLTELKGWNLRPDGVLVKLAGKDKATFGNTTEASFDTATVVSAVLPRVTEGSLVAFETVVTFPGLKRPVDCAVMEQHPIRRWELEVSRKDGLFSDLKGVGIQVRKLQFDPWLPKVEGAGDGSLRVAEVPALPVGEPACAFRRQVLPSVEVRFLDPQWPGSRTLASWETLAGWYYGLFGPMAGTVLPGEPRLGQGLPGLQALHRWFGEALIYKQVYRTPERDNVPLAAAEVLRKRYGDCKDLACLFIALARQAGFEGFPVLARIQEGPIQESEVLAMPRDDFDHVIVALRLERTLGLAAEVATPQGRFLLVDPTDAFTPLGRLGAAHRGGRGLICLPGAGIWAVAPEAAILRGELAIHLEGAADAGGAVKAQLRLQETGGLWGLRAQARRLTADKFRAYLEANFLNQGINGHCEIQGMGDPLDLAKPFEVQVHLTDPRALRRQGADWVLEPALGLPAMPAPLTRPGRKRQLPLQTRGDGRVVFTGTLELPVPVRPVLPEHQEETSFRTLSWKVSAQAAPGGCTLTFRVEDRAKDARFPLSQLAQGVEAWKKDRALVRSLLEDGMALAHGVAP